MKSLKPLTKRIAILLSPLLAFANIEVALAQAASELSLKAVEPYTAEFDYFVDGEVGEMEKAGTWTDNVSLSGGLLTREVKRYNMEDEVDLLRTVIVDRESISPVRIQQRFGPGLTNVYQIDFNDQTLTQVLLGDPASPARISSVELSEPGVETGLQAVFVLSLPIESPGEITVRTYEAGPEPKTVAKTFHIMGQEQTEVMGQTKSAWRVEDRSSQWTYWVRKNKPYIVKVVHPVPGGKTATSILTSFN